MLPGDWAAETTVDCPPQAQARFVAALQRLGYQTDLIVIDVGNGRTPAAQRFWQAADLVVLVTTPDRMSILDAYAAIKVSAGDTVSGEIITVVNQLPPGHDGHDIQTRIEQACRRFLGRTVLRGPLVRSDPAAAAAAQSGQPLVATTPAGVATRGIEELAAQVVRRLHRGAASADVPLPAEVAAHCHRGHGTVTSH